MHFTLSESDVDENDNAEKDVQLVAVVGNVVAVVGNVVAVVGNVVDNVVTDVVANVAHVFIFVVVYDFVMH